MATTDIGSPSELKYASGNSVTAGRGAGYQRFARNFLLVTDFVFLLANALLVWYLKFIYRVPESSLWTPRFRDSGLRHASALLMYAVLFALIAYARKLYSQTWFDSPGKLVADVSQSAFYAALIVTSAIYVWGEKVISREVVCATVVSSSACIIGWRLLLQHWNVSGVTGRRKAAIVGTGAVGRALHDYLAENRHLGYRVVGFIDRRLAERQADFGDAEESEFFLGTIDDLPRIVRKHFIDEILVTTPSDRDLVKNVARQAREAGVSVRLVPDLYDGLALGAPIEFLGQFPTMALYQQRIPALQLLLKRSVDVVAAALALLVLSPLFALVAAVIKWDSRGPVFYRSRRVGKKGGTFTCYKFRTMVADAEQRQRALLPLNERDGILFKISNDPRITRVGRWLRKFSVDELPQLWNVLKGDMSLVGPRPPVPGEYTQYELGHLRRLAVVPGITGLWQVKARQSPSFEEYIDLDLQYVDSWSFWLDLKLLLKTVCVVFAGTGT